MKISALALAAALTLPATDAVAVTTPSASCPSYRQVTDQLREKYGEQLLFSGFPDKASLPETRSVYEVWGNPTAGSWTLIVDKLILFQNGRVETTGQCAFVIQSGRRHSLLAADDGREPDPARSDDQPARPRLAGASRPPADPRCLTHSDQSRLLQDGFRERPVLRALTDDETMLEVYAGAASWTLTRTRIGQGRDKMSQPAGEPQEVRRLCTTPMFSGKTWALAQIERQTI